MQMSSSTPGSLIAPRHLAVIMDGNGRWAQLRGKQRVFGHKEGAKSVRRVIKQSVALGVKELTLFAFSSENWKRPALEVNALMALFVEAIKKESKSLLDNGIKTKVIGDLSRFPTILQKQILKLEELTKDCNVMTLNIAANYGGRWDILHAVKSLASDIAQSKININELNEDVFSQRLSTVQNVDLMIRTGGEKRISNFLLWQAAYAELYFTDVLWPDFDENELIKAVEFFNSRERRFGQTSEQVKLKDTQDAN